MKEDIKKKFLDILFETEQDEEEIVVDKPIEDIKLAEKPATLRAQDFLYNKNQSTSFINVKKEEKKSHVEEPVQEKYSIKPNISPMFGVLGKDGEAIKKDPEEKPVNMSAPLKKSHDSYLGTIISPIYGYDVKNDLSNTMNLSIHKVEPEEEVPVIEEKEEKSYYVKENDILEAKEVNAISEDDLEEYASSQEEDDDFINTQEFEELTEDLKEDFEEDFIEQEMEDYASDPIFKEVLKEERGYTNTEEIDLFEDLFKEDEE